MKKTLVTALATLAMAASTHAAYVFQDTFTGPSGAGSTDLTPEVGTWKSASTYTPVLDTGNVFKQGANNGILHVVGTSTSNNTQIDGSPLTTGVISFDFFEPDANSNELRIPLMINSTTAYTSYFKLKDGSISLQVAGTYTVGAPLHVTVLFNTTTSAVSAPGVTDPIAAQHIAVYLGTDFGSGKALPAGPSTTGFTASAVTGIRFSVPAVGTSDFYLDNVTIAPIPEPTAIGVFGVAGLTLLRRSRQ